MRQENPIAPGSTALRDELECWADATEALHRAVERVLKSPVPVSAAPLRAAVRRLGEHAVSAGSLARFAEIVRAPLAEWLSFRRWLSAPSVHASAAQTVGWLFWAQRDVCLPEADFELLLFAAVLKDSGLLLLESQYKMSADRLAVERPAEWELHPLHSAGLAGGLADVPARLADLVASHHERLDGTGFPRELKGKSQRELSRYFALVCRFVDLLQGNPLGDSGESADASLALADSVGVPQDVWSAAMELQQEVRYGHWDAGRAGAFLNGIAAGTQARLDELLNDPGQQRQLVLRRRWRRDVAHGGPEPRLARVTSASTIERKQLQQDGPVR